jgi:hypothetical protein
MDYWCALRADCAILPCARAELSRSEHQYGVRCGGTTPIVGAVAMIFVELIGEARCVNSPAAITSTFGSVVGKNIVVSLGWIEI